MEFGSLIRIKKNDLLADYFLYVLQ